VTDPPFPFPRPIREIAKRWVPSKARRPDAPKLGALALATPLLMEPVPGGTTPFHREIVRRYGGCGLPATEVVRADHLLESASRNRRLEGIEQEPPPLAITLWEPDVGRLERCAAAVRDLGGSVLLLDLAGPLRGSRSVDSGAGLLDTGHEVARRVRVVVREARIPVAVRIALGTHPGRFTAPHLACVARDEGASLVVVEGRFASGFALGFADWMAIARVKAAVDGIVIAGSGDLTEPAEVAAALALAGVDGAMIGGAALARPWLYRDTIAWLEGRSACAPPAPSTLARDLLEYLDRLRFRHPDGLAARIARREVARLTAGLPGARRLRRAIRDASTPSAVRTAVRRHLPRD